MVTPTTLIEDDIVVPPLQLRFTWHKEKLVHITLQTTTKVQQNCYRSRWAPCLHAALTRYCHTTPAQWPVLPLAWERVSPFARTVLQTLLHTVGWGRWTTYGVLAQACQRPGGARAIGQVMRHNPWPIIVPCHRVLAAKGRLGGFSSGLDQKKLLLSLERLL
ncbi:MAG: methylated-DNA--[protein]-cysteine S-methyltransferase [Thermodesulfobacteriota bacterium]